jgi:hypothetical protein
VYRAAADCLRSCANLSWTEHLDRERAAVPPDAVLLFADDFNMIDSYGVIERELLGLRVRCLVVVARHKADYQPLAGIPGAADRLKILPPSEWEHKVRNVISACLEAPA